MVYLQRCLFVTWLVPRETAAVSAPSVYTIQPCTMSRHFMQSYIGRAHVCLAATCTFGGMAWDFVRATAVTRGWNGYQIQLSMHDCIDREAPRVFSCLTHGQCVFHMGSVYLTHGQYLSHGQCVSHTWAVCLSHMGSVSLSHVQCVFHMDSVCLTHGQCVSHTWAVCVSHVGSVSLSHRQCVSHTRAVCVPSG